MCTIMFKNFAFSPSEHVSSLSIFQLSYMNILQSNSNATIKLRSIQLTEILVLVFATNQPTHSLWRKSTITKTQVIAHSNSNVIFISLRLLQKVAKLTLLGTQPSMLKTKFPFFPPIFYLQHKCISNFQ